VVFLGVPCFSWISSTDLFETKVPLSNGNAATLATQKPTTVLLLMTVGSKCCSV